MKNNKYLIFITFIYLFLITGCGNKSDDEPKAPELSQTEMYQRFKSAYTNRNIYEGSYTEKNETIIDDGNETTNEIFNNIEITYNKQTKEGYKKDHSKLENEGKVFEPKEEMYIVKNNNQYLNYYLSSSVAEEYNDIFIINENYLLEKIEYEKNVEEYISKKNPNQYSSTAKYAEALGKVLLDSKVLKVKKQRMYQDNYEYTFTMEYVEFNVSDSNMDFVQPVAVVKIKFDDLTIKEYSFTAIEKYTDLENNTLEEKTILSYFKKYDSEGMNFDFSKFAGKAPGEQIEVEYRVTFDFMSINEDILVKKDSNILNRMKNIENYYMNSDSENVFEGWYYDNDYKNKIGEDDIFTEDIKIYGKGKIKQYNITKGNEANGTFSVVENATKNSEVTVYATPNVGYVASEMYYIEEGTNVKKYFTGSFVMPSKNVTVYVVFDTSYYIKTKEQLIYFMGEMTSLGGNFTLHADIDLGGMEWTPIGDFNAPFRGSFDGNDHTISNFKITKPHKYSGFFGYALNSDIKNLVINNFYMQYNHSNNVYYNAETNNGGLVGMALNLKVYNVRVNGRITINRTDNVTGGKDYVVWHFVGGLCGRANGNIEINHSYSNVDINVNFKSDENSVYSEIGGLIGNITAYSDNAIVLISNSYNTGNINCEVQGQSGQGSSRGFVGGIIGRFTSNDGKFLKITIESCYFSGNLNLKVLSPTIGGLVGAIYDDSMEISVRNLFVIADIKVETINNNYIEVGAIFGDNLAQNLIVEDCYSYDGMNIDVSGYEESYKVQFLNIGEKESKENIWQFVYDNWDENAWHLSLGRNPILK